MKLIRRGRTMRFACASLLACVLAACGSSGGSGNGTHLRTITLWVPAAPGGSVDTMARLVQPGLQKNLGVTVVVQNDAGANSISGYNDLVQRGNDCSSLLTSYIPGLNYSFQSKGVPYKPSDFVDLANVNIDIADIRVLNGARWKTFADFLADAKAHPGKITVAVQSLVTSNGAGLQALEKAAGVKFNIVTFGGSGDLAREALLGNKVDANASNIYNGQSIANKTRVLAVQAQTNKWPSLTNNAPTMTSVVGKPIADATSLEGIAASATCVKDHPALAKKISEAVAKTVKDPSFLDKYKKLGQGGSVDFLQGADLKKAIDQAAQVTHTPTIAVYHASGA